MVGKIRQHELPTVQSVDAREGCGQMWTDDPRDDHGRHQFSFCIGV